MAHAGYMLIGLAAAPYLRGVDAPGGVEAVLYYLAAYGAMTIGAFAVISYLNTPQRPVETVDDLAGLSRSRPGVALLMMLFLFSLIGIPATGGFAGKFLLFWGAMSVPGVPGDPATLEQARLFRVLALIGVLDAAVGAGLSAHRGGDVPAQPAAAGRGSAPAGDARGRRDLCGVDDRPGCAAAARVAGRHGPRGGAAGAGGALKEGRNHRGTETQRRQKGQNR